MECIALKQMIPDIFALNGVPGSDIWEQDILFRKGKCYLVEAASGTGKTCYIYGYRNDYRGKLLLTGQPYFVGERMVSFTEAIGFAVIPGFAFISRINGGRECAA